MAPHPPGPDRNFAELLWRAADRWPGQVAIVDQGVADTTTALRDRAGAVARSLLAAEFDPATPVCILLQRGSSAAAAFFGVLAAGGIACFVNEAYRPRQIRHVLSNTGARFLITSDAFWRDLQAGPLDGIARLVVEEGALADAFRPVTRPGEAGAQITYTSGSTGQPKGVLASHANLWAGAEIVPAYLGIRGDDRIASLLPFSFVYGFNQLACTLATGSTLLVIQATLARDILERLRESRATVLAGVPPLWMQLLPGLEEAPLADLRVATCAGGRLAPELVRRLRSAQPRVQLFLMYGLSEVFRSTFLPPAEVDEHPDSMGRAIPRSEVLVVREDGSIANDDEVGELVHRGPTVAIGYWKDPDGTARVFRFLGDASPGGGHDVRAVFSGDLVRRDAAGLLYYVGRRDRMIKTLGFRVSPEEVADTLLASGVVTEAAVTAEPDPARGQRIVAHVCLAPDRTLEELRRFCGNELPRYMQPARYQLHAALPRGASGKIDLAAL